MVEMHVEGLSLDPQTRKPIVILRQNDGKGRSGSAPWRP